MTMIQTFKNITAKDAIRGEEFTVKEACQNDYNKEILPVIPADTKIIADFAGDFGMYATAEVDGVMHKLKFHLHELHKIDFGSFDARNV